MSTISKVMICNMALRKVGEARIVSLKQAGVTAAKDCDLFYDQIVKETLEEHNWAFARKRVNLALLSNDPTQNWSYAYALPTDNIRVRSIDRPAGMPEIAYELEGDMLYTNEPTAVLIYTSNVTDPVRFSPGFVRVLVLRLAMEVCTPIRDTDSSVPELYKLYQATLRTVTGRDSSQQTQVEVPEDTYIYVRR